MFCDKPLRDKPLQDYSTLHRGPRQGFVTEGPRQRFVTGGARDNTGFDPPPYRNCLVCALWIPREWETFRLSWLPYVALMKKLELFVPCWLEYGVIQDQVPKPTTDMVFEPEAFNSEVFGLFGMPF